MEAMHVYTLLSSLSLLQFIPHGLVIIASLPRCMQQNVCIAYHFRTVPQARSAIQARNHVGVITELTFS